ncbi:MAG: 50S ribosomal protein L29 [Proteobacteria bacterium]|nr:50S ribosomal protein L29 [Pseudomonadota bacterium]
MKPAEIRDMSVDEIEAKIAELTQKLFNLRFQHATGQLENTAKLPATKKNLARCRTILAATKRG